MNSTTKMTTHEFQKIQKEACEIIKTLNDAQIEEIFGKLPTPPPATWIEEADVSVKKRMIIQQINIFREWCFQNASNPFDSLTAEETLDHVKRVCDINDLNIEIVKEVFDQVEAPFYYNIKKDEAVNPEDEYDSSDSDEDEEDKSSQQRQTKMEYYSTYVFNGTAINTIQAKHQDLQKKHLKLLMDYLGDVTCPAYKNPKMLGNYLFDEMTEWENRLNATCNGKQITKTRIQKTIKKLTFVECDVELRMMKMWNANVGMLLILKRIKNDENWGVLEVATKTLS
jgi:hypothetical protein